MQVKLNKICTKCNTLKPIKDFHKRSKLKSGYRSECKVCGCSRRKKYHYDNHSKSLKSSKEWKENNSARIKEYSREYYLMNKDLISKKKKKALSKILDNRREYRLRNKDRYAMHKATRRFLEKASSVYNDEFNQFLMEECYSLSRLRSDITGIKWHVDHVVPLNGKNVCGLHVGINLRVIPAIENLRKSNNYE